eukprot:scaffold1973_cov56-Phaeocystis_antarctica.AAC.1
MVTTRPLFLATDTDGRRAHGVILQGAITCLTPLLPKKQTRRAPSLPVVAAALTASTPDALRPVSLPGPGSASQRRTAHRGLAQFLFLVLFQFSLEETMAALDGRLCGSQELLQLRKITEADMALLHRLRCEAVWQEAAMRIQAAWRSYDAAVVEGVHIAAALIQAAWRSYDAAACIKAEYAAEAGVAAAAVRLQAAVRGCLQRVYWRTETWGEDAEGPPLTITMHLIFKREQQIDDHNTMLIELAVE